MADIEGVGAVLEVKKDILDSLKEAQFRINQLSLSSEKLATNFSKVTSGMSKIANSLTNKKFEIHFNDNGATASIENLTKAIETLAKLLPSALKKVEVTEASLAQKELAINEKIADSLRKRSDTLAALTQRMKEMAQYTSQLKALETITTSSGNKFVLGTESVDNLKKMAAATTAYKDRIVELGLAFDSLRASQALDNARNAPASTYDEARKKIELAKNALLELKKAGTDNSFIAPGITKFVKEMEELIAKTQALLPSLKEADKAAAKAAAEAKRAQDAFNKAFAKADAGLVTAAGLDEKGIDRIKVKIQEYEKALARAKQVAGQGIVPPNWTRAAEMDVARLKNKLTALQGTMNLCNRSAQFLSNTMRYMFNTMMLYKVVKDLVSIRGEFEKAEKSLGVILKDAYMASDIFHEIQEIAVKSPFQVKDLVKQTKQLAAYRIEADKLISTTKMLGDISAGVGVDMNRLILAYGQVKAATVLKGTELRQFSEAGVNMLGGLAKRFSDLNGRIVTTGEVLQMVTKKMVSFEDVDAVLRSQVSAGGTFYRMQEKQAETLAGQISNLKDRLDIAYNEIGKGTQGMMNASVKALTWLIKHYKLLANTVGYFIVFKTFTGLATRLGAAMKTLGINTGAFVSLIASDGLRKTIQGLWSWPIAIGAIAVAVTAVTAAVRACKHEEIAFNKAIKQTQTDVQTMERDYRTLIGTIQNTTLSMSERNKAMEELKSQFGDILPLEDASIEKITAETDAYYGLVDALREYGEQNARTAAQRKAVELVLEKENARAEKIYNQLQRMAGKARTDENWEAYAGLGEAIHDKLTPDIIKQAFRGIQNELLRGTMTTEEAAQAYYESLANYLDVPANVVQSFYAEMGKEQGRLEEVFDKIRGTLEKGTEALQRFNLSGDLLAGDKGQEIVESIKNIGQAYNEKRLELLGQEGSNSLSIVEPLQKELVRMQNDIAQQIRESGANSAQQKHMQDALEEAIGNLLLSPMEMAVAHKWSELASEFPSLLKVGGLASMQWKSGQDTPETYVARLNEKLNEYRDIRLAIIRNTKGAQLLSEDDKRTAEEMIPVLESVVSLVKEYDTTMSNADRSAYQSDLKALIEAMLGARKEMETLDDESIELFERQLDMLGKKVGINMLPDFLDEEALVDWLETLKNQLSEKDYIEIKLKWNKEQKREAEAARKQQDSDLRSFIRTVFSAQSEIKKLDAEAQGLFKERLQLLGQKINVSIPDFFNTEDIDNWLQSIQDKFTRDEFLEIALEWMKIKQQLADDGAQAARTYESNLKSFVSEVTSARKEIHGLDAETRKLYMEQLRLSGKKVGMVVPSFLNDEEMENWLETLKKKLSREEWIKIKIGWNKDKLQDTMQELGDAATELWDKLDTAKTFQQYGVNMPGFNVEKILEQLREVEQKYRNLHTKDGDKSARELAERRLKITRDEQKEAAKIIYESQKQVLDQVGQAYQNMYNDVNVMQRLDSPDAEAGVMARIKKGFLEAADAQWELYKKTEMYTAAFGDLEGLSKTVLQTLRDGLQSTLDMGGVSATDIKTIRNTIDDLDEKMSSSGIGGFFATIREGFASVESARSRMANLPNLEAIFTAATARQQAALEEMNAAQAAYDKDQSVENYDRLVFASNMYTFALSESSDALAALTDEQKTALRELHKGQEDLDTMKQAYDKIGDAISGVVDLMEGISTLFGGEMSAGFEAAAEGLKNGFAIVSTAISAASSVMALYTFVEDLAIRKSIELKAVMQSFLPLAIIGASLAAVAAIVKARDVSLQKQVEAHKKAVEDLDKAYDKLDKTFDKTLTLYESMSTFNQMTSNLQKQRREIEEAISADQKRKQTQSVKDEIRDLENQLDELGDRFDEMSEKKMDFLGGTNDYQSLARDWAESWLDAFRETGNGLSGLEDSFQEFIDNIIVGQLSTRVVGQFMEQKVQPLVDAILADWKVDQGELNQLKSLDLSGLSEALSAIYQVGDLATSDASGADSTLQKGIQNVTETTAQALEALLNSTRFFVADSNAILARLEALFTGAGDIPNPMLSEMRMHTEYLRMLSGAVSANGKALNVVVKSI